MTGQQKEIGCANAATRFPLSELQTLLEREINIVPQKHIGGGKVIMRHFTKGYELAAVSQSIEKLLEGS